MNSRIDRLHQWSLYAVVLIGFLAMATGGMLGTLTCALFVAGIGVAWFVDRAGWGDRSHTVWWNLLAAAFFLGTAGLVIFTDQGIIAGIRLLLLLVVIKLLSRHRIRDELQLYALAFVMMAAATAVNDDIFYGIFFGLFVLGGTFSLALFHLKRELGRDDATAPAWTIPFDRRYMTVLAGISLAIFVASLGIFLGFPRIGLGYFAEQGRQQASVAGFSDNVELGSHGVIRDNPEVVLRVEFPDGRPASIETLHWRTMTFDHYDGTGWSRTLETHNIPSRVAESEFDLENLHLWREPEADERNLPERIEMYVEPLGSDTLPTLWPARRITFGRSWDDAPPGSPRAGGLRTDPLGDVHHTVGSDVGIPYTVVTRPRPAPEELREVRKPIETSSDYFSPFLQVPDDNEPVAELADRITSEAETPYAKAEAVEEFLRSNYAYTTDLPQLENDHPVQGFLFETRRGHCEYYASAMALMLRSVDIPTRMVNGFLGGKWNGVGDYLAVRQGDAHSWVEVFVPDYGWIQMDPTPPGTPTDTSALVEWYRETLDAARMKWVNWVIEYDLDTQIDFVQNALSFIEPGAGWQAFSENEETDESGDEDAELPWREILLWGGLALLALPAGASSRRLDPRLDGPRLLARGLFWSLLATGWLAVFVGLRGQTVVAGVAVGVGSTFVASGLSLWRTLASAPAPTRLFARIERVGHPRRDGEPPAAFLERLAELHPDAARQLHIFRRRYLAARFGPATLEGTQRRRLERLVDEICRDIE